MRTEIANTVKALRKQYGLTQEEAARKAGVSLAFIRELEQGKTTARTKEPCAKLTSMSGTFWQGVWKKQKRDTVSRTIAAI